MIFKYVKFYKVIEIGDFGGKIFKFEYILFFYLRVLYYEDNYICKNIFRFIVIYLWFFFFENVRYGKNKLYLKIIYKMYS